MPGEGGGSETVVGAGGSKREGTYRRMTIHYKVWPDSIIFSRLGFALDAIFSALNCRVIHRLDESIEESEVPKR